MRSLIIIIIITVLVGILLIGNNRLLEGLTSDEAIKNVASVYNTDKMSVTNLNVTGEELANYIRTNKLLINTDLSNNQAYNHDVANALNDLNGRLIGLINRVSIIEKNYVDKRKPAAMLGYTGGGPWGAQGVTITQ
jgi:hypothetical protein